MFSTAGNSSCGKVMFLQVSANVITGEGLVRYLWYAQIPTPLHTPGIPTTFCTYPMGIPTPIYLPPGYLPPKKGPGTRDTLLLKGPGTRDTYPLQEPGIGTHISRPETRTCGSWAVCILLECPLVLHKFVVY